MGNMSLNEFKENLSKYDLRIVDVLIKNNRELEYIIGDKLLTNRTQEDVFDRFSNFIKSNNLFYSTITINEVTTLYGPYSLCFHIIPYLIDDNIIIEKVRETIGKYL